MGPKTIVAVLKVVLGLLLLVSGVRGWRSRQNVGDEPRIPRWMASIDSFTPVQAFGLGVGLSSVGNLAIVVAVGLAIGRAQLDLLQQLGAVAVFLVIGSFIVGASVLYHVLARASASRLLTRCKPWLLANNATLTAVLFVVVGILLLVKGASGLGLIG